ncbi:MAG: menaquinone-dependent protoporphyrinogen IX dehydrogenase [Zetaproteobacteria bacterium CG06_land_8_20_14_3_00_59_53]|nr:MAG: protoporphyrinogen oxidase [Zetaproteobacteria bacterium CG2_30_59_37]PIO90117.1 MAG: menaquinone-dependent protoporphyrinogen IX dehydrogenase [Zetaproteobacteria bacterium CG23_combo_of_CG06-09_8_20_14_all_59_86]PIQ64838.1 MAG: menaquinone-dependent protoporphyrinogen IX dehydrogenase [Zetaproteobacteria bacterium CG11_big_fil_rev_8_21_14_0_20_59_439]PIU69517.1 MAG: menaquinone-dependent protoporphyrinogen IX dehydrogenase [Zetaproteobacteria bacterium CG06_land_8_20_14_3_00_59_53]PIU
MKDSHFPSKPDHILILHSSTDGHTLEICERIQSILQDHGTRVALHPVHAAPADPGGFDKIIIGARIRYGHHHPDVYAFIERHQALLASRPSAFFSVNLVARKPGKRQPDTNPYVRKFLKQIAWKPDLVAVFAGKVDYRKYGFFDRQMIRMIMLLTHGPTHPDIVADFTDWAQVDEFAELVSGT